MSKSSRILLADDDKKDVKLSLMALAEKNLVSQVDVVHDGVAALDYLFRRGPFANRPPGHPALVILDLKMPKVDGKQVLREIKTNEKLKMIPVVILTSSPEERDIVESYRLHANAYVIKPVDFDQFTEAVKYLAQFWVVHNESPVTQ